MTSEKDKSEDINLLRTELENSAVKPMGRDSDLGKEKHQELHQDFKKLENQNTLSDPALISPLPGESKEQFQYRVEQIQLNRFGFEGELTSEDRNKRVKATHPIYDVPLETSNIDQLQITNSMTAGAESDLQLAQFLDFGKITRDLGTAAIHHIDALNEEN